MRPRDNYVLLIAGGEMGAHLAAGLARAGGDLLLAGDMANAIPLDFECRAALGDALSALIGIHGRPAGIIIAIAGAGSLTPIPLEQMDDGSWAAAVDAPLRQSLFVIQALHDLLPRAPPPMLFLGPSTGLMGAPGLAPLAAVVEGQRALAKMVSRQWGADGWRVNWVGMSPAAFAPQLAAAVAPRLPEASGPAGGADADLGRDVTPLVELLFDPRAHALAGATIILDGGYWMVP